MSVVVQRIAMNKRETSPQGSQWANEDFRRDLATRGRDHPRGRRLGRRPEDAQVLRSSHRGALHAPRAGARLRELHHGHSAERR